MRNIKYVVVHCTATAQTASVESIKRYWKEKLNWKSPGYHYLVEPDGNIVQLLDEDKPSNGVAGYNSVSMNVCYTGGIDRNGKAVDNRTEEQKASLVFLLERLKEKYPRATIKGHRDFSSDLNGNGVIEPSEWIKSCPCFDAEKEYKNL